MPLFLAILIPVILCVSQLRPACLPSFFLAGSGDSVSAFHWPPIEKLIVRFCFLSLFSPNACCFISLTSSTAIPSEIFCWNHSLVPDRSRVLLWPTVLVSWTCSIFAADSWGKLGICLKPSWSLGYKAVMLPRPPINMGEKVLFWWILCNTLVNLWI